MQGDMIDKNPLAVRPLRLVLQLGKLRGRPNEPGGTPASPSLPVAKHLSRVVVRVLLRIPWLGARLGAFCLVQGKPKHLFLIAMHRCGGTLSQEARLPETLPRLRP